jgi:hypothetical protein
MSMGISTKKTGTVVKEMMSRTKQNKDECRKQKGPMFIQINCIFASNK